MIVSYEYYDLEKHKYRREVDEVPDSPDVLMSTKATMAFKKPHQVIISAKLRPGKTFSIPLVPVGKGRKFNHNPTATHYKGYIVLNTDKGNICAYAPFTGEFYRLTEKYTPATADIVEAFLTLCDAPQDIPRRPTQGQWEAIPYDTSYSQEGSGMRGHITP